MSSLPDDASLPPSVDSDDALSLPPSVGDSVDEVEEVWQCCKKGLCKTKFDNKALDEYKMQFTTCTPAMKQAKVFEKVKLVWNEVGEDPKKTFPWSILGHNVRRRFWEKIHSISPGTLDTYMKYAKAGHTHLPEKGPRMPRSEPASNALDVWFLGLYQHLAEPLAVPGSGESVVGPASLDTEDTAALQDVNHPMFALVVNADKKAIAGRQNADMNIKVPRRYLNFTSELELFHFYKTDEEVQAQVSKTTFHRGWQKWSAFLPLKHAGRQSKCNICASLNEARANEPDALTRNQIDADKKLHLDQVMADRRVNVRGNKLASDPGVFLKNMNDNKLMKITIDGVDQAKFVLPRSKRLVGTSALAKAWRPQLHVTGVIVWGLLEYYCIMPSDTPKDSCMNITIISRVLDLVKEMFQKKGKEEEKQFSFPPSLLIASDNTPRESKNTFFAEYCGFLVQQGCFQSVQVEFLQVDHTHNELDQRFSSMCSIVKDEDCLQDPADVVKMLQSKMRPAQGRDLFIEEMPNTWDFRAWFTDCFHMHISGLTSTKTQSWANHVWHFRPRLLVTDASAIEVHHPDWSDLQEQPLDIILSVKQYMASADESQPPQLFLGFFERQVFLNFLTGQELFDCNFVQWLLKDLFNPPGFCPADSARNWIVPF